MTEDTRARTPAEAVAEHLRHTDIVSGKHQGAEAEVAAAILAALDAAGWVVVPKVATEEMTQAVDDNPVHICSEGMALAEHAATWRIMLAARPK